MTRPFAHLLIFVCLSFILVGCGGGGSSNPPPAISVSFSTAPPASLNVSATAPIAVTVSNDSSNSGVIFSCMPTGACGTFTAITPTTATYNAPVAVPSGGSVTIMVASVKDSTKTVQATVSIGSGITVTISTAPPPSLSTASPGNTAVIAATTNDSAGVTWSCTPANTCGSFTPTSTATTVTTTYTAPAAVPTGGSVTVIATSVTDSTKSAQATVTITAGSSITVTISTAPPASLSTASPNNSAVIAATTNDTAGVKWTCTPANTCGSFTPTSTLTTVTTTYTAPTAVPTGGSVTIIATSVTDSTKSAQATVAITGTASLATLKGQYAFLVISPTGSRGTGAWAGSVNLDGVGGLTAVGTTTFAGVEDVVTPVRNDQADPIIPTATNATSKYTVDKTGHGQITMFTNQGETLTISFVITSVNSSGVATHAEIIEADGAGGLAGDPGSGTLDLQDPTAFSNASLAHVYSFTMTGIQNAAGNPPESIGGVLDLTVPTGITGLVDIVTGGKVSTKSPAAGSQIDPPPPDANGRGTFHLALPSPLPTLQLGFYVVNSKVIRIFEKDNVLFIGGSMYFQGAAIATPTLSGPYVYQHSGWSTAGRTVAAGLFGVTAPSTTISAGISDANSGGLPPTTPSTAKTVTGSFVPSNTESNTVNLTLTDAAETTASTFNAYLVDSTINILDPNNPTGGGGALLLHTDANINGTGILLPQVSPKVFSANYALNLLNSIAASTQNEIDLVGILISDGSANFTPALADYIQAIGAPAPQINLPLSGKFAADASNAGRYTGSFTVTSAAGGYSFLTGATTATATPTTFNVVLYQATTSQAFVVETDTQAITQGQIVQQNLP